MSFGVELDDRAELVFYSWDLPLDVYEEIERRWEQELSEHPKEYLRDIGGTLQYACRVERPGIAHRFLFRVRYAQDEETLIIYECFHFPLRP